MSSVKTKRSFVAIKCRNDICLILDLIFSLMMKEFCLSCVDVDLTEWRYCHVSWHGVMASHMTWRDMCPVMVSWSSGRSHCKQEAGVYAWENINDTSSAGEHSVARSVHYSPHRSLHIRHIRCKLLTRCKLPPLAVQQPCLSFFQLYPA